MGCLSVLLSTTVKVNVTIATTKKKRAEKLRAQTLSDK